MDVDWQLIVRLAITAFIVIGWTWTNDYDVAKATRPDSGFPWFHAVFGAINAAWIPGELVTRNWLLLTQEVVVAALCARVIWHWWRRRRQGKPSRVLGVVRDLGHRLTTVNVPATEGVPHRAV